jgi:hypothetical protein
MTMWKRARCASSSGVAVTLLLAPAPAAAQLLVGADATLASQYVWRGVARVTNRVLQPSTYIALGFASSFLTAGAWWNVELERAAAGDHTLVGPGARGVGETDFWLEYASRESAFDWRVGLWHYRLHSSLPSAGLPARFSTTDFYAAVSSLHLPVLLRGSGWLDAHRLRGVYYEFDASYALGTDPEAEVVGSLFVGGRLAGSHGLARDPDAAARPFYFARDGLVFYELYAQLAIAPPLGAVPLVVTIAPRYTLAQDPVSRRDGLRDRAGFFWLELAVSWRARLAGPRPSPR